MVSTLGFAVGGLLQGVGQGLIKQAEDNRLAAVEQARQQFQVGQTQREIDAHHADTSAEIASHEKINTDTQAAEGTRQTAKITADSALEDKKIAAEAPERKAREGYYNDIQGSTVYKDDDGFLYQVRGSKKTYITDDAGNKTKGESAGGSGGKNPEGVVGAIADDLQKNNPGMSRTEALEKARGGKHDAQVDMSKERLAQNAWKNDPGPRSAPKDLDYWREQYGLKPKGEVATPTTPKGPAQGFGADVVSPDAVAPADPTATPTTPAAAPASAVSPPPPPATSAGPAPPNPADRKIGTTYTGAGGKLATWTGTGWQPVTNAP